MNPPPPPLALLVLNQYDSVRFGIDDRGTPSNPVTSRGLMSRDFPRCQTTSRFGRHVGLATWSTLGRLRLTDRG